MVFWMTCCSACACLTGATSSVSALLAERTSSVQPRQLKYRRVMAKRLSVGTARQGDEGNESIPSSPSVVPGLEAQIQRLGEVANENSCHSKRHARVNR